MYILKNSIAGTYLPVQITDEEYDKLLEYQQFFYRKLGEKIPEDVWGFPEMDSWDD